MKKSWILLVGFIIASSLALYLRHVYESRRSETALLLRASQYWEAIRENDLVTAYQLEAETAAGTLLPHDVELKREWGLRVVEFKLGAVEFFDDYAEIKMTLEITYPDSTRTRNKSSKDLWTFTKGYWFHGAPGKSSLRPRNQSDPAAAPWNPFNPQ